MTKITIPTVYDNDTKYYIDGEKVYFTPNNEIKGADIKTFELYIGWFAKDKNCCYFQGSVFKSADVGTFEVLNWAFAKDKNNVYTNNGILKNADTKTFEVMGDGYNKLSWIIPGGYGKDSEHIFCYVYGTKTIILKDADIKTFEFVTDLYGKDKNYVFWNGKKLKNANPKTWKLLDGNAYSVDDKNAYCGNELIKDVDVKTFEVFTDKNGGHYARDGKFIYNNSVRIGISTPDWFFDTEKVNVFLEKQK